MSELIVIAYADAEKHLNAVLECLAYQHPQTRNGLRQDVSLALVDLRRELSTVAADFKEQRLELFKRYGREVDGQWRVERNSAAFTEFERAVEELARARREIKHIVRLGDLVCRGPDGDYVPIEPRGLAFDDLGPLLVR